jgi:hypothetical protein
MICFWCKKEIKEESQLVMDFFNHKKKKNKQGILKQKYPYHKDCYNRKRQIKEKNMLGSIVSGGTCTSK